MGCAAAAGTGSASGFAAPCKEARRAGLPAEAALGAESGFATSAAGAMDDLTAEAGLPDWAKEFVPEMPGAACGPAG